MATKPFKNMYYVVRRVLDQTEELAPFKGVDIVMISEPDLVEEVKFNWVGQGNEGQGLWNQCEYGDAIACKLHVRGKEPILVTCTLKELSGHLHETYEDALYELKPTSR